MGKRCESANIWNKAVLDDMQRNKPVPSVKE